MKKTIFIRRRNPNTKIPDYIHKESTKKLSSVWAGNGVLRGLTAEEEKMFLPPILGISVNSADWEKELKEYWSEFSYDIPSGTGYEVTIEYDDDGKPIKEIRNLEMFVLLNYAKKHPKVADDESSLRSSKRRIFYIFDPVEKSREDAIVAMSKSEAMKVYLNIYQDNNKVHQVLTVMDYNPENLTEHEISTTLLSAFEKDHNKFVRVVEDEKLEMKYFIANLVKANIVKLDEGIYFDIDKNYGTLDKFMKFLNDPINSQERMRMEAKVEGLMKVVSKIDDKATPRPEIDDPFAEGAKVISATAEEIKKQSEGSASKEENDNDNGSKNDEPNKVQINNN